MSRSDYRRLIRLVILTCFAVATVACAPEFTDENCQDDADCFIGEQCVLGVCQQGAFVVDMDPPEDMFVAEDMGPDADEDMPADMPPDMRVEPIGTVRVMPLETTLDLLETVQLELTVLDAEGNEITGRDANFESSLESVASVDEDGLVTARAEGSATITATIDGVKGRATISVIKAPVASVVLTPNSPSIGVSGTVQFSVMVENPAGGELLGRDVSWSSDDEGILTVDAMGLATGISVGTTDVVATVEGVEGSASVSVVPEPVDYVTITPASGQLEVTDTLQLEAKTFDDQDNELTGRMVIWTSSDNSLATVDNTGLVTGEGPGDVLITATSEGKSAMSMIAVVAQPVDRVDILPSETTLNPTDTLQYTAIPRAADGTALTGRMITWSSSDNSVATVNSGGLVTAQAVGPATITADVDGVEGSGILNVVESVVSVDVTPSSDAADVGDTTTFTATPKDSSGNSLTGRNCTFSSQDQAVATIDSMTGVATVQSEGDTTITATCEGISGTATLAGLGAVATVSVSPISATIGFSGTQQFTVELRDSSNHLLTGRAVSWSSSDMSVATISSAGLATASASMAGTVTVTATSEGIDGTAQLTVTP